MLFIDRKASLFFFVFFKNSLLVFELHFKQRNYTSAGEIEIFVKLVFSTPSEPQNPSA